MLKCPKCGSEEFVTYKKVPVKVDKWCNVIDSTSDLTKFELPYKPYYYLDESIICAQCHTTGSFGLFNVIDGKDFMKKTSILKK